MQRQFESVLQICCQRQHLEVKCHQSWMCYKTNVGGVTCDGTSLVHWAETENSRQAESHLTAMMHAQATVSV